MTKWNQNSFTDKGSVTIAGGNLLALNDNGDLVVIQPTTNSYTEIHRTNLVSGLSCMTTPTIANGRMYVRTHDGPMMVYQVGVLGGGANPTGYLQFASSTYSVTENNQFRGNPGRANERQQRHRIGRLFHG